MREKMMVSLSLAASVVLLAAARPGEPPRKTPELLEKGKASFDANCASCHGAKGEGDGVAASALDPKPRNLVTDSLKNGGKPAQVFETLGKGIPGTAMVAFTHLPEQERWALAYYVTDLRTSKSKKK